MKMKHLEVHPDTHKKIKAQALERDMTIREYITWLAEQNENIKKG